VFQIHNTGGIRGNYVGSFNTISNIEAQATTRLSELWYEQKLGDTFSVRFGQLAADAEFLIADYSELNLALVYQAQIVPGWTIQPAVHYVMHPGGHIADPNAAVAGTAIRDATVLALRSVIVY
jgi:carbohydrate-selective porin OprB